MRVKIGTYYLAGDPAKSVREHSPTADLRINGQLATDLVHFCGGANVDIEDRGGLAESMEFSTTREFPSLDAAEQFVLDYYSADNPEHDTSGDVTIESEGGAWSRTLKGAVIHPPARSLMGVTVFLRYRITFESIETPA